MAKKHIGVCKLTGLSGKFVESHILPKALTRLQPSHHPFIQGGSGRKPIRRWSSWTDKRLVIREGENILRDLDTWAILSLRRHQLVWSGWNGNKVLVDENHKIIGDGPWGLRTVDFQESKRLRLFFLSLLWRAAASNISEMNEVVMPPEDLDRLTEMVRNGKAEPLSFYPMVLFQLSTIGPAQNLTPIAQTMTTPDLSPEVPAKNFDMFRFYFDGLMVRFYRQSDDEGVAEYQDNTCVGSETRFPVGTITYEQSFQAYNLAQAQLSTERDFPDVLQRLAWPPIRKGS